MGFGGDVAAKPEANEKLLQSVTAATFHVLMSRLKAVAPYSAARVGQSCGMSSDVGARG